MNTFKPTYKKLGNIQQKTINELKEEPMFWCSDFSYVTKFGGPISKEFLKFLNPNKDWIIDSRVHMLMKGWLPCIGGWHCDALPRDTPNKQPNFKNPSYIGNHIILVMDVNTESLTEFATSNIQLPDPPEDEKVFGYWSPLINDQQQKGKIKTVQVSSGTVVEFDSLTFHRGIPAKNSGWRMFIRASTNIPLQAQNEIRKQTNVYIESFEAGW